MTEGRLGDKILESALSLAVFSGLVWYFVGGGVQGDLARAFENEYFIAKQTGSQSDVCFRAGAVAEQVKSQPRLPCVSEGYLQARHPSEYGKCRKTEAEDCAAS